MSRSCFLCSVCRVRFWFFFYNRISCNFFRNCICGIFCNCNSFLNGCFYNSWHNRIICLKFGCFCHNLNRLNLTCSNFGFCFGNRILLVNLTRRNINCCSLFAILIFLSSHAEQGCCIFFECINIVAYADF